MVKTIIQLASENPLHSEPVDKQLWTVGEYAHYADWQAIPSHG
jgi:hypothetical protein